MNSPVALGCHDSTSMVDNLGSPGNWANKVVEAASRFRVKLTVSDAESQMERRIKLLSQLNFPPFAPKTEAEFEDWVDIIARQVTKYQLCVALFQDAWEAVADTLHAKRIGSIPVPNTHEELVDIVAHSLFKCGSFVKNHELKLLQSQRCVSVFEARSWVEDNLARLYRLCIRWSYPFFINDQRLIEIAL